MKHTPDYHAATVFKHTSGYSMSSSTSNISLARSRSLRIPPPNLVKPATTTTTPQTPTGPSNITLFLTNLRLLDLDLRSDWPGISALTFSTKDAQQNQKKRIQCVEWALYQLFALWDAEEAKNVLLPHRLGGLCRD
ncbi:MAG: hypothetical protein CL912_29735 [Deltaproteobacteria bacterium]|nr:hypothetical protein [Deltaproteobacteria bacterium]